MRYRTPERPQGSRYRRRWNALICRMLLLDRPMANLPDAAHTRGMAALDASLAPSRELGLATVARLSRYRGTSREHTESDLLVFFGRERDDFGVVNDRSNPPKIAKLWSSLHETLGIHSWRGSAGAAR